MLINEDFKQAYNQIRKIYEDSNKKPEILNKFIFSNKWNVIFTDNMNVGMAFNFTGDHAIYGEYANYEKLENIQNYVGKNLFELVEYLLLSEEIQERAVCLAALNALSQAISSTEDLQSRGIPLIDPKDFDFVTKDDLVSIVGYGGLINRFYGKCKELHILDMRPKSSIETLVVGEKIEYTPKDITFHIGNDNEEILGRSDIVIMTGCTLANGSFKEIVKAAKGARIIGMFGPSAQIIPEFLLEHGINYTTSSRVVEPEELYSHLINPFYDRSNTHSYMEAYTVKDNDILI